MPTKVTIGEVVYDLPKLKFKQLKTIFPRMRGTFEALKQAKSKRGDSPLESVMDTFTAIDDAMYVIAAAYARTNRTVDGVVLDYEKATQHWLDFFNDELEPDETAGLTQAIWELMNETGLIKMGEPLPAGTNALLDELAGAGTGTRSLPS